MSRLLQDAAKGEKVYLGARGQAQFQIVKLHPKKVDRSKAFGYWKDKMWVADDAFSRETDKAIADLMLQENLFDPNKKDK